MFSRRSSAALITVALLTVGLGTILVDRDSDQPQQPLSERAKQYYVEHRADFERPESRPIRHILVKSRADAQAIHRALRGKGEQAFARTASKHSIDRSTSNAGGLTTIYRGEAPTALDRTAFTLRTGELSPPIRTPAGYSLVLATGPIQAETTQPYSEVQGQIKTRLRNSETQP